MYLIQKLWSFFGPTQTSLDLDSINKNYVLEMENLINASLSWEHFNQKEKQIFEKYYNVFHLYLSASNESINNILQHISYLEHDRMFFFDCELEKKEKALKERENYLFILQEEIRFREKNIKEHHDSKLINKPQVKLESDQARSEDLSERKFKPCKSFDNVYLYKISDCMLYLFVTKLIYCARTELLWIVDSKKTARIWLIQRAAE